MPGDDFTIGQHTAKIVNLEHAIDRIEQALKDHRDEESIVWEDFKSTLNEFKKELIELRLFKSKILGIAAAIATAASIFWHAFLTRIDVR